MIRKQFPVHDHIGAGRAEVSSGSFVFSVAAEKLNLNGDRKILIDQHGFRILTMQHGPAVVESPSWTTGRLLAHKTVLNCEQIVAELLPIKQVTKLLTEIGISLI